MYFLTVRPFLNILSNDVSQNILKIYKLLICFSGEYLKALAFDGDSWWNFKHPVKHPREKEMFLNQEGASAPLEPAMKLSTWSLSGKSNEAVSTKTVVTAFSLILCWLFIWLFVYPISEVFQISIFKLFEKFVLCLSCATFNTKGGETFSCWARFSFLVNWWEQCVSDFSKWNA